MFLKGRVSERRQVFSSQGNISFSVSNQPTMIASNTARLSCFFCLLMRKDLLNAESSYLWFLSQSVCSYLYITSLPEGLRF